jgi:hypothetical protein
MMALVYFVDSSNVPEALGDAYAEVQDIDDRMTFGNCAAKWTSLTTIEKEDYIKAITRRIDSIYTFFGIVVDDTQPLQFPRKNIGHEDYFSIDQQKATLINYIAAVIEFELTKTPIGAQSISQGSESLTPRQQQTPREAVSVIGRYVRR